MVRPKMMARLLWLCSVLLLLGACGGGGSSSPAGQDDSNPPLASQDQDMDGIADASDNCPAISNAGQSDLDNNGIGDACDNNCGTSLTTVQPYACRIAGLGEGTMFSLSNQPEGMVIQPRSGQLQWTPAVHQQGRYSVVIERVQGAELRSSTIDFVVSASDGPMPAGLYVSPSGSDDNDGSPEAPLASLIEAGRRVAPGDTIYLRGGDYFNEGYGTSFEGRRNNLARFTSEGSAEQPITLRNWGNEYPRLISDVNGLSVANARHWIIEGLELIGSNQQLNREISLAHWWDSSDLGNRIQGRGIALNDSFDIVVRNCVVHDFPGAGISNNGGAKLLLENNLIYNNVWWSTAGSHGVANSKPETEGSADASSFKITMRGNLLFANQSLMISHVFSKGVVKLEIDEGNGLHMQNNAGVFFGRFLAENNLVLLNGKAGLGLNTIDGSVIRNNAFWRNARSVVNSGELSIQSSSSDDISRNLFHAAADRATIKDFQNGYIGVAENYAVAGNDAATLPASVIQTAAVFADPEGFDFSPAAGIPNNFGVPADDLLRMSKLLDEYGVQPAEASTQVTEEYIRGLRQAIFESWPAPVAGDDIPDNLKLLDPETDFCYRYEDRGSYPNDPDNSANCS